MASSHSIFCGELTPKFIDLVSPTPSPATLTPSSPASTLAQPLSSSSSEITVPKISKGLFCCKRTASLTPGALPKKIHFADTRSTSRDTIATTFSAPNPNNSPSLVAPHSASASPTASASFDSAKIEQLAVDSAKSPHPLAPDAGLGSGSYSYDFLINNDWNEKEGRNNPANRMWYTFIFRDYKGDDAQLLRLKKFAEKHHPHTEVHCLFTDFHFVHQ